MRHLLTVQSLCVFVILTAAMAYAPPAPAQRQPTDPGVRHLATDNGTPHAIAGLGADELNFFELGGVVEHRLALRGELADQRVDLRLGPYVDAACGIEAEDGLGIRGDQATIEGFRSKDGTNTCNARSVKLPSGKSVFAGSADDGAPKRPAQ